MTSMIGFHLILTALFQGFILTTVLLCIGRLVLPAQRERIEVMLKFSNFLVIFCGLGFCIVYLWEHYWYYEFEKAIQPHEREIYEAGKRQTGPHWFAMWAPIIVKGLLPQFFWIKRLRRRFLAPIVLVALYFSSDWLADYLTKINHYWPTALTAIKLVDHSGSLIGLAWPAVVWWKGMQLKVES